MLQVAPIWCAVYLAGHSGAGLPVEVMAPMRYAFEHRAACHRGIPHPDRRWCSSRTSSQASSPKRPAISGAVISAPCGRPTGLLSLHSCSAALAYGLGSRRRFPPPRSVSATHAHPSHRGFQRLCPRARAKRSSSLRSSRMAVHSTAAPTIDVVRRQCERDRQVDVEARRRGAQAFLRKPFGAEVLIDAITLVLA